MRVLCLMSLLLVALIGVRDTDAIRFEVYGSLGGSNFCVQVAIGEPLRRRRDAADPLETMPMSSRFMLDLQDMVDHSGETYVEGTAEDNMKMFHTFDGNCDGYIDVTEWSKLSPVDQFIMLLESSDANGDSRISLMELESTPLRIYPEKEFMMMPMDNFKEMESSQEEKGRKGAE